MSGAAAQHRYAREVMTAEVPFGLHTQSTLGGGGTRGANSPSCGAARPRIPMSTPRKRRSGVQPVCGSIPRWETTSSPAGAKNNAWLTGGALPELHGPRYYSVLLGNSILILNLDSNSSLVPGSEQIAWKQTACRPSAVCPFCSSQSAPPSRRGFPKGWRRQPQRPVERSGPGQILSGISFPAPCALCGDRRAYP